MILRRLSQSLKAQNWTAIWIEFILLVSGVFLGIQVSNWNAERENRTREKIYITNLVEDIRSDIVEIDNIIRISSARLSALNYLIGSATKKELPTGFDSARGRIEIEKVPPFDENDPNTIGFTLFILSNLDGSRLTYDSMINTGAIGIFRDDSLVRSIRSYYANVDLVYSFDKALLESRWKMVDAQQQSGLSPVDLMSPMQMTEAFAKDRRLLAAASNYWLYTNRQIKEMRALRLKADSLVAKLESEKLK